MEEVQNATRLMEESVDLFCQGSAGGGGVGAGVGMFFFFLPHKMDLVTDVFLGVGLGWVGLGGIVESYQLSSVAAAAGKRSGGFLMMMVFMAGLFLGV